MKRNDYYMDKETAIKNGYSADKRKRRRQHRRAAAFLLKNGGFFNSFSARGSMFGQMALWHLYNARMI